MWSQEIYDNLRWLLIRGGHSGRLTEFYCPKIPIISPVQIKGFFAGLIFGGAYFRGACYWKEFCISKWVGLDNKNRLKHYVKSLKQLKTVSTNSPWGYIREGLSSVIRRIFASEILEAYFRQDFLVFFWGGGGVGGGLIIRMLWYLNLFCYLHRQEKSLHR